MTNAMKKLFVSLVLMVASLGSASAFDFDGIDLNLPFIKVAQEISKRGYAYDSERNCLKGICKGTEIYLDINYLDVKKKGMVGQLKVEIPMRDAAQALRNVTELFNVIYHQTAQTAEAVSYEVDKDGTQLVLSQSGGSIYLTYNTPYYKEMKK